MEEAQITVFGGYYLTGRSNNTYGVHRMPAYSKYRAPSAESVAPRAFVLHPTPIASLAMSTVPTHHTAQSKRLAKGNT
uniref:Uncharacterized protein n=1 Tax=Cannabis sativa TaxID=3483 RepID=A0A803Q8K1_CANSA